MPKQTVKKKPVAPKRTTKPKAKTTTKPAPKPRAKTKTTPKPKTKPAPAPVVVVDKEVEFPYDMFPWKLVHKERNEKRTCYFQCEEHRKKHIVRYNLNKKDIIFMGYKYD
jgi:hypothetical protein